MEVDSGSCYSLLNSDWWNRLGRPVLRQGPILKDVSRNLIPVLGIANVEVQFNGQFKQLRVVFLDRSDTAFLLGREPIAEFNFLSVHQTQPETVPTSLTSLLTENSDLFDTSTLPPLKGFKAHLHIKPNSNFKLFKPRPVPYALRPKVEAELDRLESLGIISKVETAEFSTTPIVPVLKPSGQVRICGEFKVSVNQYLDLTQYPLPHIEEVFERLSGGKVFSKLDLPDAYLQVELDDESKRHVVITTHRGLYRYNHLCFGLSSAPAIFQGIEQILRPVKIVQPYLDDIALKGSHLDDHLRVLRHVFQTLRQAGVKLKREKCVFVQPSIKYLGHILSGDGLRPDPSKVEAVVKALPPANRKQLESFLGLVQYYGRHVPNLSSLAGPLNEFRKKEVRFEWTSKRQSAYDEIKKELSGRRVLTSYSESSDLYLAADASEYGLGAVLSQKNTAYLGNYGNNLRTEPEEHVISYASRTLSAAERNYSQVKKEALAIIFGVKKFEKYLMGRHFTMYTDHKPLVKLFDSQQAT